MRIHVISATVARSPSGLEQSRRVLLGGHREEVFTENFTELAPYQHEHVSHEHAHAEFHTRCQEGANSSDGGATGRRKE